MEDIRTMEELIAAAKEATAALEALIRNAEGDIEVPDGVPNDYTAKITSESYDEGYKSGYNSHKHDVFVPMLIYSIICGVGGVMIGLAVV